MRRLSTQVLINIKNFTFWKIHNDGNVLETSKVINPRAFSLQTTRELSDLWETGNIGSAYRFLFIFSFALFSWTRNNSKGEVHNEHEINQSKTGINSKGSSANFASTINQIN